MAHWVKITACDDTTNILPVANFGQSVWEGMNNCTWSEYSTVVVTQILVSTRRKCSMKNLCFWARKKASQNRWKRASYLIRDHRRHRSLSLIHWWWCYPTTWCLLLVLGPRQALLAFCVYCAALSPLAFPFSLHENYYSKREDTKARSNRTFKSISVPKSKVKGFKKQNSSDFHTIWMGTFEVSEKST